MLHHAALLRSLREPRGPRTARWGGEVRGRVGRVRWGRWRGRVVVAKLGLELGLGLGLGLRQGGWG